MRTRCAPIHIPYHWKRQKMYNIASYDLARRARGSARAPFFCTPTCWVDQVHNFWYLYHYHNVKIDEAKATQSFSIFRKMSFSTKFFSKNEFSKKKWVIFSFFKPIDLSEFWSYTNDQIIKKYLQIMNFTNQKFFTPLTSFLPPILVFKIYQIWKNCDFWIFDVNSASSKRVSKRGKN